jgi:hypothetical protein
VDAREAVRKLEALKVSTAVTRRLESNIFRERNLQVESSLHHPPPPASYHSSVAKVRAFVPVFEAKRENRDLLICVLLD